MGTRITPMVDTEVMHGDAVQVMRMTESEGMNNGRGYSLDYVRRCLKGRIDNEQVVKLHERLVALRTPRTNKSKK